MVSCTLKVRRIKSLVSIEECRARKMTNREIGRSSPELAEPSLSGGSTEYEVREYCDIGWSLELVLTALGLDSPATLLFLGNFSFDSQLVLIISLVLI
jgi:hypothetical protein